MRWPKFCPRVYKIGREKQKRQGGTWRKKTSWRKKRRRRRRFEVIAVNQLSCGSGDSLSEGMRDAKIAITAPTLCAQRWFSATLDCSTFRWVTKPSFLLLAVFKLFNSTRQGMVKLAPASFKESWKRTWWLERARLYARPIPRRPRTCILTLPRGARRPFEEMEGWGLGWLGVGYRALGVGEIQQAAFFTTLPPRSSLPDPELPQDVCQLDKGCNLNIFRESVQLYAISL